MDTPTDNNGKPICARPCRDGMPCYRQVPLAGVACSEHDPEQPILPLPDDVPTYKTGPDHTMTRTTKSDTDNDEGEDEENGDVEHTEKQAIRAVDDVEKLRESEDDDSDEE